MPTNPTDNQTNQPTHPYTLRINNKYNQVNNQCVVAFTLQGSEVPSLLFTPDAAIQIAHEILGAAYTAKSVMAVNTPVRQGR